MFQHKTWKHIASILWIWPIIIGLNPSLLMYIVIDQFSIPSHIGSNSKKRRGCWVLPRQSLQIGLDLCDYRKTVF